MRQRCFPGGKQTSPIVTVCERLWQRVANYEMQGFEGLVARVFFINFMLPGALYGLHVGAANMGLVIYREVRDVSGKAFFGNGIVGNHILLWSLSLLPHGVGLLGMICLLEHYDFGNRSIDALPSCINEHLPDWTWSTFENTVLYRPFKYEEVEKFLELCKKGSKMWRFWILGMIFVSSPGLAILSMLLITRAKFKEPSAVTKRGFLLISGPEENTVTPSKGENLPAVGETRGGAFVSAKQKPHAVDEIKGNDNDNYSADDLAYQVDATEEYSFLETEEGTILVDSKGNDVSEVMVHDKPGPSLYPIEPGVVQIFEHPGAGKTRKYAIKAKEGIVTGPTRVVARELYKAFSDNKQVASLHIAGTPKHMRNQSGPQVMPHALALRVVKQDTVDKMVIDEAHFENEHTQMLVRMCRRKAQDRKMHLIEMTATGRHIRSGGWILKEGSNYPITDIPLANIKECIKKAMELGSGNKVLLFLPTREGINGTAQVQSLLLKRGIAAVTLDRATFEDNIVKAQNLEKGVICSTNISECGANLNVHVVIDTGVAVRPTKSEGGVIQLREHYTTKAARVQRRGRVGRVPGKNEYYYVQRKHNWVDDLLEETAEEIVDEAYKHPNGDNLLKYLLDFEIPSLEILKIVCNGNWELEESGLAVKAKFEAYESRTKPHYAHLEGVNYYDVRSESFITAMRNHFGKQPDAEAAWRAVRRHFNIRE